MTLQSVIDVKIALITRNLLISRLCFQNPAYRPARQLFNSLASLCTSSQRLVPIELTSCRQQDSVYYLGIRYVRKSARGDLSETKRGNPVSQDRGARSREPRQLTTQNGIAEQS